MSDKEEVQDSTQQPDNRLEAVRELLFGQNVQEYRGDIKETRDLIEKHRSELDQHTTDMESRLNAKIDALEEKLISHIDKTAEKINNRLDKLQESKVDKKKLADYLVSIAKKLDV